MLRIAVSDVLPLHVVRIVKVFRAEQCARKGLTVLQFCSSNFGMLTMFSEVDPIVDGD